MRRSRGRRRAAIVRQNDWYDQQVRREAEALASAGFDVEVVCVRAPGAPRRTVVNGVTIVALPVRKRDSSAGTFIGYGVFLLRAAAYLSVQHLRRPYALVQANSMPDFLVFAALVPKLLGARVVVYMQEPTPELAETILGRK